MSTITGQIFDAETNQPIEGVEVTDGYNPQIANDDGSFIYSTNKDTIYFHRVGYISEIWNVDGDMGINVYMAVNPEVNLSEVEITGERDQPKKKSGWLWLGLAALALAAAKKKRFS